MARGDSQQGYTLVELLVVIAIIGLILAIAAPATVNTMDAMHFRSNVRLVTTALARCHDAAVREHKTVLVSTGDDILQLTKSGNKASADWPEIRVETPVRCFADGTTTGGKLTLTQGNRSRTIIAQWLTGTISVE